MAATIEDVARQCGVSTATVSRALRGLPNVAPSTRARVLLAAEQLNYSIDVQASRLASGRAMTVGLILPLIDQWFFFKVSTAAEIILLTHGYDVLRVHVPSLESQTLELHKMVNSRKVDGLIIFSTSLSKRDIELARRKQLPMVTVESTYDDFPSVLIDNIAAAQAATNHLLNLGHSDIALLGGLEDDPMRFIVPRLRRDGYIRALTDAGIEPRDELMVSGNFSAVGGAEAMAQLLSIRNPPSAVFAMCDEMAIGAMKTIRNMGLRVPDDLSVVGFDDHDLARYLDLTTVRQPVGDFGERAAEMLLKILNGEQASGQEMIEHLSVKLMIRATTGPRLPLTRLESPG